MKTLLRLTTPLCLALACFAGCDAPTPAELATAEIAAADPPATARETIVESDPDEPEIEFAEYLGCDAVPISEDGEPMACDGEDACDSLVMEVDPFEIPGCPVSGDCSEDVFLAKMYVDNACGSCNPAPNMPGWQRTKKSRWCNACGCCMPWVIDEQYCVHC